MKSIALHLLLYGLFSFLPEASHSEIYKYRDENGRLAFVDDKSRIPQQFREDSIKIDEFADPPHELNLVESLGEPPPFAETEPTESPGVSKKLKRYQTPVIIQGNRVIVPASIAVGNRTANLKLLLDTGASVTVLHRSSLASLELPGGRLYKARIADGSMVSSEKIRFQHLKVGPFREEKPFAMVIDPKGYELPFDGMLGMDFLRNHPYTIDFDREVITWNPGI